jgi:hypothetical protein
MLDSCDRTTLYEKGALTNLEINDPLHAIYQEIHKALGSGSANKRVGAKTPDY